MKSKHELAEIEKYPVIQAQVMSNADRACDTHAVMFGLSIVLWILFSAVGKLEFGFQFFCVLTLFLLHVAMNTPVAGFLRSTVELKAKGIDINDRNMRAVMPWDWLTQVEIKQRKISWYPNYVYFKFKNGADVVILWNDIRETIDATTLISCVRTWAPHSVITGDTQMSKTESIATYTELWLRDMSSGKAERRLKNDQFLSEGTILSESYQILQILSGGGQGTAYLASVLPQSALPGMPPRVVIKEFILPDNDRGLQKTTDNLNKEVAILRRINHPQIVRLYDFFIEDMRGYFAIEYIDGLTLRQIVSQSGPLCDIDVAKIGLDLCDALIYMHELSPAIIHGDVTPDNVMLNSSGGVKLMDFDASQELTRNKTNTVVGKHSYMSPEQFKGLLGAETDVYAFGCTLHFMLTGFDPEPITESHPRNLVSTVGEKMDQIVARATALDGSVRYSSMGEIKELLKHV